MEQGKKADTDKAQISGACRTDNKGKDKKLKILLLVPTVDTCYEYVLPLGLMNLYLIGEELGCEMSFIDLSDEPFDSGMERVLENEYDLVGVTCQFTNAAYFGLQYAGRIKEKYPHTMVMTGGNHATLVPEDFLHNSYDLVICGEGEVTFRQIVERLQQGQSYKDLKGIAYLDGKEIFRAPAQDIITNIDTLPFNDYSRFDLEPYFKWAGIKYINMETTRGCIYNCSFCATVQMWGNCIRVKSPQRIVDEFKVAKRLGCEYVFLVDDDTAIREENMREFCKLLIEQDAIVPWGTTLNSRSIKDDTTYALLREAGCIKANICIESANERLLRIYRKPYKIEDNRRTCAKLVEHGILVHNHGIIGYHDETLREMLNTYFYLIKTSPMWHISILEPRPGSDYWGEWDKKGDIDQYKFFGKANVFLTKRRTMTYVVYRLFAAYYFFSPFRLWEALFEKSIALRYNHRVQYRVAWRTIKANLAGFLSRFTGNYHK